MKVIHTKDGRTLYKDDQGHWLKKGDAEKLLSNQKSSISQEDNGVGVKALMNLKGLGLPQAKKLWDSMSEEEKHDLITKTKEHEGSILRNVPVAKKAAFEKSLREVSDVRDPNKETQIAKASETAKKLNDQSDDDKDPFVEGLNMTLRKNEKGGYTAGNGRFEVTHRKGTHRVNIPGKNYSEIRGYNYWELTDNAIDSYQYRSERFSSLKDAQSYIDNGGYKKAEERHGKRKGWWKKK